MESQTQNDSVIRNSILIRITGVARRLGIGFLAAVITGVISGLLLRFIMRIIALAFPHMARGFTFQGTFILIIVGVGFSLANSIIFTAIYHYLPTGWVRKGVLYGCINLVIYGIPFFLSNPDNDLFGPQAPLGIGLFSALFILGGLLLSYLVDKMISWFGQSKTRIVFNYIFFGMLIVPALVMAGGIVYEIFHDLIPSIQSNFW
ncbi:hypothetical protein [Neobacillus dielmonensis]|uniref:hypothetical protein n=1 Tax=Neobacillus dielmonensis TaxID=1347369 RepID=UPI0005A9235D|nr:hypothetical protein [Neobacillus dielmonensis]